MPSFKTLLKLGRVSNLPTVWSNVMLVVALYTPNLEAQTLLLMLFFCFAGSFAYIGGMFLNDAFDADYDRQHQPFRPIPAGEISRAAVFSIGFLLLLLSFVCFCLVQLDMTFDFTGTGSSFFINFRPYFLIVSAGLYGSIVLYDWIHKKFAFSVLFMAAARSFLILTVATTIVNIMFIPGLIAAAVHFVYVCSLTIVARLEGKMPAFKGKIPYLIAGISAVDAALILVFQQHLIYAALFLLFVPLTLRLQKWVRGT